MSRRIRSHGLLGLSVALMASAGGLAYVLDHDAIGSATALSEAAPGSELTLRGVLQPFAPSSVPAREAAAWSLVLRSLDNFTYVLDTGEKGAVVLVTSPQPGPAPGTTVVTRGDVLLRLAHPDGSGRALVLVHARDLASPILFR